MAHINIKPLDRRAVHVEASDAIACLLAHPRWSKDWSLSGSFSQTIGTRRAIDNAIKAKDATAFVASRRRGYWRVELAASH